MGAALIEIEYKGKGFWTVGSFMEPLSYFICQTFESRGLETFSTNNICFYKDCDSIRSGIRLGAQNIDFSVYSLTSDEIVELKQLLQQCQLLLNSLGEEVGADQLNLIERQKFHSNLMGEWSNGIKTQSLISTIAFIIQLLDENLSVENEVIYYQGFDNPDGFITV